VTLEDYCKNGIKAYGTSRNHSFRISVPFSQMISRVSGMFDFAWMTGFSQIEARDSQRRSSKPLSLKGYCLTPVEGSDNSGGQFAGLDVALAELRDHFQVARVNVHEGKGCFGEFGQSQQVLHQAVGEADGTVSDHGDF
jgi:hypothetical protein